MRSFFLGFIDDFAAHVTFVSALIGIVAALAGPIWNLLKEAARSLKDRSWDQRAIKNTALITQCIRDLQEAERPNGSVDAKALEPYSAVLKERLESALQQLRRLQERLAAQANRQAVRVRRRFEEPAGLRRRLLWYRPYGFAAWILHSSFYGFLCMGVASVVQAIHHYNHDPDASEIAAIAAIYLLVYAGLALLPRAVALRNKRLLVLGKDQINPNRDLNWGRRLFLIFRAPDRVAAVERFFCYTCWPLVLLDLSMKKDAIIRNREFRMLIPLLGWMLISSILSYDVWLRRALAELNTLENLGTQPVSNPADAPLTSLGAASGAGH